VNWREPRVVKTKRTRVYRTEYRRGAFYRLLKDFQRILLEIFS
jgi:hypothetical protein